MADKEMVPSKDGGEVPKIAGVCRIHKEILIALVRGNGLYDYAPYVFPIPRDASNEDAGRLWRTKGTKLPETVARYYFGNLMNKLEVEETRFYRP